MKVNEIIPGTIVQHFKRELLAEEEKKTNRYLYQIIGIALHSETGEQMVVYQAMYGDFGMFVRPMDMFLSQVDHEKYPQVRAKDRFTVIK